MRPAETQAAGSPFSHDWYENGKSCFRIQLPLKLRYAITVHKSQGQTLGKVIVHLGDKEQSAGLSFVALSRTRRFEDLLVHPISLDRLKAVNARVTDARRKAEEQLQGLHRETLASFQAHDLGH